jgi:predicted nucleic acid-binding protein
VEKDLLDFVSFSKIYPLDNYIVEKTIEVRRFCKIILADAIIAATCLRYGYVLVTNNINDFKNIAGLEVINPYEV